MQKYLIAGMLVAGMISPAFAAEYYVAQSSNTHKCSGDVQEAGRQVAAADQQRDLQEQARRHEGDEGHERVQGLSLGQTLRDADARD
jgi:hypothetical protein